LDKFHLTDLSYHFNVAQPLPVSVSNDLYFVDYAKWPAQRFT